MSAELMVVRCPECERRQLVAEFNVDRSECPFHDEPTLMVEVVEVAS